MGHLEFYNETTGEWTNIEDDHIMNIDDWCCNTRLFGSIIHTFEEQKLQTLLSLANQTSRNVGIGMNDHGVQTNAVHNVAVFFREDDLTGHNGTVERGVRIAHGLLSW